MNSKKPNFRANLLQTQFKTRQTNEDQTNPQSQNKEKWKKKNFERQTVPLKHCTSGFYSTPQVVELPERNSESKGTKDQPRHTFSNTSHA